MMKKTQHPQIIIPTLDITLGQDQNIKKSLAKIRLNQQISITFFGSDSFVIPVLQALQENFEVTAVVTAPGSAIELKAQKLGIPTLTPSKLDSDFLTSHLSLLTSDLHVVASYGKILPQALLDIPQFGSLNVHPSLLPKYRGASPVPATILAGDKTTGVTIIKMDQKMDHGSIVITKKISLSGQEDFTTLINKLFQEGATLLVSIIPDFIDGKLKLTVQNHSQATFTKLLTKESGYFDINNPPNKAQLNKMIRAYHPWPGVWTYWEVQSAKGKVKRVIKFYPEGKIQMEGKKLQSFKDFLNGYPNFPLKNVAP